MKTKKNVVEIEYRTSDLKDRIKKVSETEKKNADETLKIIKKILDCNKNAQKKFPLRSKVDKGKSVPKKTIVIKESVKLRRRRRIAEIKEEEKNIRNELFKQYYTDYRSPSDIYKKLRKTEGKRKKKEDQVYLIKVLNRLKKKTLKRHLRIKNL